MITIKQIPSQETYAVRNPVLRPGKPVESCVFEGDDLESTVHFGLYEAGALAGIASVFLSSHHDFEEDGQRQLRGMAVLPNHLKKGFGERLVAAAEEYAKSAKAGILWFNAREAAVGFYEKLGYQKKGGPFVIQDIGPHYIMYKKL